MLRPRARKACWGWRLIRTTARTESFISIWCPGRHVGNGVTHLSQFQVSAGNPNKANFFREKSCSHLINPRRIIKEAGSGSARAPGTVTIYISRPEMAGPATIKGPDILNPAETAKATSRSSERCFESMSIGTMGTASIPSNNPFFWSGTFRREICIWLRNPFRDSSIGRRACSSLEMSGKIPGRKWMSSYRQIPAAAKTTVAAA